MAKPAIALSVAKKIITGQVAGYDSDPYFYSKMGIIPNPDPILRRMGVADSVYDAILADAHVIGEVRTMRAGLMGYQFRLKPGADDTTSMAAFDLCKHWYSTTKPSPFLSWDDVRWNMFTAVLYGFKPHELVWQPAGKYWLPEHVLDRPNRRFVYTPEREMRILTRSNPMFGEAFEPYQFVVTRHMPTHENPYGCALLSSCFWPYTFKNGGFKFFYQFCERFGMPWPVGRYPQGSQPKEQDELLDALLGLAGSGAAAIPEGSQVELLESHTSGQLAQEALINLCNREMSKALTSQTLGTDMLSGGSYAAAQTHVARSLDNGLADRNMVLDGFDEIFRWITLFNFGPDVTPPVAELYRPTKADLDRMSAIEKAVDMGADPSKKAILEELELPAALNDSDRLSPKAPVNSNNFSSCQHCGGTHDFAAGGQDDDIDTAVAAADNAIANAWIEPALRMLDSYITQGKTLREFQEALPKLFGDMDDATVESINKQVLMYSFATGLDKASNGDQ